MARDTAPWLTSAVVYSVFVRNHGNPGTFDTVTGDLERIRGLGTDILWLMPIHPIGIEGRKGSWGSPYAITDYRALEPSLGTWDSFARLVERTHALGMKVILDIVFNHTSPDSLLAKAHPDWFLLDAAGKPMPKYPDWWDIVDLQFFGADGSPNQGLWDELIDTLQFWLDKGVDGFRCDVASLVPQAFWLEARRRLNRGREVIWLGETSHLKFLRKMREAGYRAWSDAEQLEAFDLSYDYDGFDQIDDYFGGLTPLETYLHHLHLQLTMLPQHGAKLRFTENHDQPRTADKIRGLERLKCWTAFHALLPGAFMVYAGQEFLDPHRPDVFELDPIPLPFHAALSAQQKSFSVFLAGLLPLARGIKRAGGAFRIGQITKGLVKLEWGDVVGVFNLEDRYGPLPAMETLVGTELLTGRVVELSAGKPIPKDPMILRRM